MKVAELMQDDVTTVRPDASVAEVIASLADSHVSAVPVVDAHRRLLGVISSSDVLTEEAEARDEGRHGPRCSSRRPRRTS